MEKKFSHSQVISTAAGLLVTSLDHLKVVPVLEVGEP